MWKRTLRLGTRGHDVASLQEKLLRLGYYTGEIDGIYGILTKDAVRDLQKAHRLRVDGIAGKEVFALVHSGLAKPMLRHFVARGETCAYVARRYNVPIELLLRANRLPDPEVSEGQCLNIPVSRLFAFCAGRDASGGSWDSYERHLAFISSVAPRWFTLSADGTLTGEPVMRIAALASLADIRVVPVVFADTSGDGDGDGEEDAPPGELERERACGSDDKNDGTLDAVLMDTAARRTAIKSISAAAARSRSHGIVLSVGAPGPTDVYAFTSFVRELARVLERDGRDLSLEIPAPAATDVGRAEGKPPDLQELAKVAKHVIVRLHEAPEGSSAPAAPASPTLARTVLKNMVRQLPPWKTVLEIPLFGVDFSAAPGVPPTRRAYSEIADILSVYKPSVSRIEPGGACTFRYRSFRVNHTVFFMDAASVATYIELVLKLNLAGLAVADLGDEDPLVWDAFKTRFKALRDSVLPA
jgi:spore germination protein YaaH